MTTSRSEYIPTPKDWARGYYEDWSGHEVGGSGPYRIYLRAPTEEECKRGYYDACDTSGICAHKYRIIIVGKPWPPEHAQLSEQKAELRTDNIDFSMDAMYAPQPAADSRPAADSFGGWLERRRLGIGCSELAVCGVIVGDLSADDIPKTHAANAELMQRGPGAGLPRLVAEKAGLVQAKKSRERQEDYLEVELTSWMRLHAAEHGLKPETVTHSGTVPQEWYPLASRTVPNLLCSPDGWARDDFGDLVALDWKRSTRSGPSRESLERWKWQLVGQCLVTGAAYGMDVVGIGWIEAGAPTDSVSVWRVEPTKKEFELVEKWVTKVWAMVCSAKEQRR